MNELQQAIWNYIKAVDELAATPYPTLIWPEEDADA